MLRQAVHPPRVTVSMNPLIVESFADMAREKGIDRDILMSVIEETFGMMVRKKIRTGSQVRYRDEHG